MRWLKSYFVEPWPQPDGDAWGERFAYVYVVPGMLAFALAGAHHIVERISGAMKIIGPVGVVLIPVSLAIHAMLKTRHWR